MILVVDDHRAIRELFARFLRELGYEVLEAEGPLQAQRLAAARGRVDLLLTDFHMPDMNGVQLARWFHTRFPLGKVLLTTTAPAEVEPYLSAPQDFVLMAKTDAFDRLAGIVHELLDGSAAGPAPADSDRLRWRAGSTGPAGDAETSPNRVRPEYEYEARVLGEAY